ncbi:MAG TPA: ATP-binding protein [Kofleriaceae bacterium]|nr:ATP-binding protein [Kofleriaceae bacterium]
MLRVDRRWIMGFRRQLWVGYSASFLITLAAGTLAVAALQVVAARQSRLAREYADELVQVERLRYQAERVIATTRGYLLTRDLDARDRVTSAVVELDARLDEVELASNAPARRLELVAIREAAYRYVEVAGSIVADAAAHPRIVDRDMRAPREALRIQLEELAHGERGAFEDALADARDGARRAGLLVGLTAGLGLALSALVAAAVMRRTSRQWVAEHRALDEAWDAAAARQEALAIVSHDLRGPLTTIVMGTDVLSGSVSKGREARIVNMVRVATDRMKHLVDQLLDAAQLDAGKLQLELADCEVEALLRLPVELLAPQAAHASVDLEVVPAREHLTVRADRERILQVLINLIGNALKFSPKETTVSVRAEACPDGVQFSVEDQGPGIHSDQLAHVFERFWHGAPKASDASVGLGLYICKKLVEAHGGRIWVDSSPGSGSRFRVVLPRGGPAR